MNKNLCMNCMSDIGSEVVCPVCGHDNLSVNDPALLAVKSVLADRFIIGKAYDINGEGVTYPAYDTKINAPVIIREYFPYEIALRKADGSVAIKEDAAYAFNNGLMEFMDISDRLLGLAELPCLFRTLDSFELNGTAYRISESVSGISLMEFLLRNGGSITWEQARPLFLPLITTLNGLHNAGIIHRGISPETIFVGRDGKLRLKSICIKAVRSRDSVITAQLYPGFAAVEQYGIEGISNDGPHTDVYGLAATLFRVLAGNPPCDATDRLNSDNMTIPAKVAETVPKNVLSALANGLQILPENRTQTINEFRSELATVADSAPVVSGKKRKSGSSKKYALIASACTAGVFIIFAIILMFTVFKDNFFKPKEPSSSAYSSIPSVASLGDKDSSEASSAEKQYAVPNLKGVSFDEAVNLIEENSLKYEVIGKAYSDTDKRGTVCLQSIAPNTLVDKETVVQITISLGSQSVKVPDVSGLYHDDAYIKLLEKGFLPENIKFIDKYDETAASEAVINTDPEIGTSMSTDSVIKVFINTYNESEANIENDLF